LRGDDDDDGVAATGDDEAFPFLALVGLVGTFTAIVAVAVAVGDADDDAAYMYHQCIRRHMRTRVRWARDLKYLHVALVAIAIAPFIAHSSSLWMNGCWKQHKNEHPTPK
jgi:hypothetical protein